MADLDELLTAARKIAGWAPWTKFPPGMAITTGSLMAKKQLTAKDFMDLAIALVPFDGPTHQHVKRGENVRLVANGRMQAENWRERGWNDVYQTETFSTLVDMQEVAIYRADDGSWWVRPKPEFNDGRFIDLRKPKTPAGSGDGLDV